MAIKPIKPVSQAKGAWASPAKGAWANAGAYGAGMKGFGAMGMGCPMGKGCMGKWGPMGPMAWGPAAFGGFDAPFGGGAFGGKGGCPAGPEPSVPVYWLTLDAESASLPGMPLEAPAIFHQKGQDVFGNASNMLWDLVGDPAEAVEIVDDAEWTTFPEVVQALRDQGAEENCLAVAACSSKGKWGVGLAGGWKHRESAAKVALAVAIAADHPEIRSFLTNYPEMRPLLNGTAAAAAPPIAMGKSTAAVARGKKQKAVAEEPPDVMDSLPEVTFVALTEESSITSGGYPADAPALLHDKTQSIFASAHHIIQDIVGDVAEEVSFLHDVDWDQLPEVGEALKTQGVEEQCYCVASCEKFAKWGIGMASGWKHRETAAKLALAVAIVTPDGPEASLAISHPEFVKLLGSIGMEVEVPKAAALAPAATPAKKRKTGKKAAQNDLGGEMEFDPDAPPEAAPLAEGGLQMLPKEQPFWLRMEEPPAILVDGMPAESLLVVEGTARKELYSTVDQFLSGFVADVAADIECVDDPDWTQFPEIATALEGYAIQDECLQVAVCAACSMWAAGVGRKWKTRNAAAKVALATLLAVRTAEGGEAVDCSEFPAFGEFIEQAGAAA